MIRQSLSSRTSVKSRDTMSSGLIRKRISSWTRPELVTPPPTNLLAKSTCDWRKKKKRNNLLSYNIKLFSDVVRSGEGAGRGRIRNVPRKEKETPDVLFGNAAGGGGITQASVPNVTVSSSEAKHFILKLPAANIKTRAESLQSQHARKLAIDWFPWYPDRLYIGGWTRPGLLLWYYFCLLLTQKSSEEKNTYFIDLAEKPTWQVIVSVRRQPCRTCIIISSRDWQSLLTGSLGSKPLVTRRRSCKEEVVVVVVASSYFTADLPKPVTQLWDTEPGVQSRLWQAVSAVPTPVGHPSTRATSSSSPKAGHVRTSAVSSWQLGGKQKVKGRAGRPDSAQEAGAGRGIRGRPQRPRPRVPAPHRCNAPHTHTLSSKTPIQQP